MLDADRNAIEGHAVNPDGQQAQSVQGKGPVGNFRIVAGKGYHPKQERGQELQMSGNFKNDPKEPKVQVDGFTGVFRLGRRKVRVGQRQRLVQHAEQQSPVIQVS